MAVIFFLLIEIGIVLRNISIKSYFSFFWFCNFAPILFAVGFLIGNVQFIKSIINIGLLTQFITLVFIISKVDLAGVPEYEGRFFRLVELVMHLLPVNAAFLLVYHTEPKAISLAYSFIILVFMFLSTLVFTPRRNNTNIVYHSKFSYKGRSYNFTLPYQTHLWIFYAFIVALITFLVQYAIYWHFVV
jgi:hypothetical protein